jgi:hypothetical protein
MRNIRYLGVVLGSLILGSAGFVGMIGTAQGAQTGPIPKSSCVVVPHLHRLSSSSSKWSASSAWKFSVQKVGKCAMSARPKLPLNTLREQAPRELREQAPREISATTNISCRVHATITYDGHTHVLQTLAWQTNCTSGVLDCAQQAFDQMESPTDPGDWYNIKDGDTTSGCEKVDASIASKGCSGYKEYFAYRGKGEFTIYVEGGKASAPGYTNPLTIEDLC